MPPSCARISIAPEHEKNGEQAIGRSRGGLTTKIHALVDALGNPVKLMLTPGAGPRSGLRNVGLRPSLSGRFSSGITFLFVDQRQADVEWGPHATARASPLGRAGYLAVVRKASGWSVVFP
jgi:hypothetical protein